MIRKVDWSDTFQYDNAYEDVIYYVGYEQKKRVRKKQTGFFRTILRKTKEDVNKKVGSALSSLTAAKKNKW